MDGWLDSWMDRVRQEIFLLTPYLLAFHKFLYPIYFINTLYSLNRIALMKNNQETYEILKETYFEI